MSVTPGASEGLKRRNFQHPPVAVAFLDAPPADLPHIDRPLPAGCSYWRYIVRGSARQIMLVSEAAHAAGVFQGRGLMGRPACAMIPQALTGPVGVTSLGCIANRVLAGLADDELYFTIPGAAASPVFEKLGAILTANDTLESLHRQRAASLQEL